jgi:hypothetical protein
MLRARCSGTFSLSRATITVAFKRPKQRISANKSLKYHFDIPTLLKMSSRFLNLSYNNSKQAPTHSMPWCHMSYIWRPLALHLYVLPPPSLLSSSSE